jgi:hypothetical protein
MKMVSASSKSGCPAYHCDHVHGHHEISILSLRANAYSEALTHASVLGHTKLVHLMGQASNAVSSGPNGSDPLNPSSPTASGSTGSGRCTRWLQGRGGNVHCRVDPVRRAGAPVSAADMRSGNCRHRYDGHFFGNDHPLDCPGHAGTSWHEPGKTETDMFRPLPGTGTEIWRLPVRTIWPGERLP